MTIVKKKVLFWGDSPLVTTGFGKINKEILDRLANTGKYEIVVLGIHYFGQVYDKTKYPYDIFVADLCNDLLGRRTFLKILASKKWDIVFTHQDLNAINSITSQIIEQRDEQGFKWILYTPIDTDQIHSEELTCLEAADTACTYSNFGKQVITNLSENIGGKMQVMWLGTDLEKFKPISPELKNKFRIKLFNLEEDNTFLIVNVNANRWRKDLPRSILGFKYFVEKNPNSRYYIHALQKDYGGDLEIIRKATQIPKNKMFFNDQIDPVNGMPEEQMYKIYGSADVVISTSMAEGWGLSCTEAFAMGIPVLFPRHTSLVEIIGKNEERGYFVDLSGVNLLAWNQDIYWRPIVSEKSLAEKLEYILNHKEEVKIKTEAALEWVQNHTWNIIGKKWMEIFEA